MKDTTKNIVVTVVFLTIFVGLFLVNLFRTKTEISYSERRRLQAFPTVTMERIGNTEFMSDFASYATDQFVGRDWFRSIKAKFLYGILKQKDNNGIYIAEGHASKMIDQMKEKEVEQTAKNLNRLYSQYLTQLNVYYSIIPDKNYFLAEKNGYPHMDYSHFRQVIQQTMNSKMKYIGIFGNLALEDYYATDIHWKQENLPKIANRVLAAMGQEAIEESLEEHVLTPFYGMYYGQSALPLPADQLKYLTNDTIDAMTVKILKENSLTAETLQNGTFEWEERAMYDEKDFASIDPYNLYLNGPRAIIVIENPKATTDRELYYFRDSFGSSLAPLLAMQYRKVTLIDLRYLSSAFLQQVVDFKPGSDALLMYSTEVLNNGSVLDIR